MIKQLLKLTGLDEESLINLLPYVLLEIRNYTNQYFLTRHHSNVSKIEDGLIYCDDTSFCQVEDTIEIMNSENNVLVYQVKEIHDDYISVYQSDLIVDDDSDHMVAIKLQFNAVNLKTIQGMLNYDVNFGDVSGIKSQSLGGNYSVTYQTAESGETMYPIELYGGVHSLRKLNDDYAEYRRKGYVRLR